LLALSTTNCPEVPEIVPEVMVVPQCVQYAELLETSGEDVAAPLNSIRIRAAAAPPVAQVGVMC
jgi:hypothetical protein